MNDSRIKMLEQSATNAAIAWAKSGVGYENMKRIVNDYIEATGANRAINNDAETILNGRRAAATRINVCAIHALMKPEEQHLHDALIQIATDGVERRSFYRHRR